MLLSAPLNNSGAIQRQDPAKPDDAGFEKVSLRTLDKPKSVRSGSPASETNTFP